MKKLISFLLAGALLLSGCSGMKQEQTDIPTVTAPSVDLSVTDAEMFTDRDDRSDYDADAPVILLEGDQVRCDAAGVTVEGTKVTITGDATYILRGDLTDGQIVVSAGEQGKPQLVLDGVSVTNSDSAALYIPEGDKVFVTLAEGSENLLANGGSFADKEGDGVDAAVFSRQDLTFNGSGSLTVDAPGGHGIVSKDDLVFTGGSYTVRSASHGVDANDSIRFKGSSLTVDAGKDGLHAANAEDGTLGFVYISGGSISVEAEGDGISAGGYLKLLGGTVDIVAGGGSENGESHHSGGWGEHMGGGGMRPGPRTVDAAVVTEEASTSMKGMKSEGAVLVSGGTVTIDSADDGIHSNGSVAIDGGSVTIASGDDGIHGETTLTVTGGTVKITESYEGLEALEIRISGGVLHLVASDDGVNAAGGTDQSGGGGRDQMFGGPGRPGGMGGGASNGSILVEGGRLYIQSSGDGMDANGTLQITGGDTVVCGPNSGDTATLDYDVSGTITGGTFIGTGAAGMAQTFSDSTQGVLAVSVGQGQSAGTKIGVSDGEGKELIGFTPELPFSVIIFSTPELVSGQTYHVTVGDLEGNVTAE